MFFWFAYVHTYVFLSYTNLREGPATCRTPGGEHRQTAGKETKPATGFIVCYASSALLNPEAAFECCEIIRKHASFNLIKGHVVSAEGPLTCTEISE
jgi:hypothetical protein